MRRILIKPTHATSRVLSCSLLLFLLCSAQPVAFVAAPVRQSPDASSVVQDEHAALHQALLDLTNYWTLMCVAAHPDDEDGATLTVLRRKYGVHTVTVFSTYGEGGQNATGPELYEELGAIRARETLAAAEIQGSEASFLALRDFGFSKSAAEAFRIWGHDEALGRMVLKIRTLRPDVIITNHDTQSGHGHHQATGRLVLEAFDAAADPRRFPEQLRAPGLRAWQAQRLFVRVNYEGGTGSKTEEEAAERAGKMITVNPNERDEVRGTTYAEQALQALHRHASQGPWPQTVPQAGAPLLRYRLAREARSAAPLPAVSQTFFDNLRLPQTIAAQLSPPTIEGQPLFHFIDQRGRILDALLYARKQGLFKVDAQGQQAARVSMMRDRLDAALKVAAGIKFTLAARDEALVPGQATAFTATIANHGEREIRIIKSSIGDSQSPAEVMHDRAARAALGPGKSINLTIERETPANSPVTIPQSEHLYGGRLFGERLIGTADLEIDGIRFPIHTELRMDVAPPVEIKSVKPSPLVLTPATVEKPYNFTLRLVNHRSVPLAGKIAVGGPTPTRSVFGRSLALRYGSRELFNKNFELAAHETKELRLEAPRSFHLPNRDRRGDPPSNNTSVVLSNLLSFAVTVTGASRAQEPVTRKVDLVYTDARVAPNLRVGYVRSFDDTLRNALAALGVEAQALTVEDVRAGDLRPYDTIIIDNRSYQAHPELISANARLLEYVHAGGTLIVFYHKANEWNPDAQKQRPQLAPYPIVLGSARVTDERAAVVFSEPQSALLNYPNQITALDFDGWIQERGLYYPKEWDARYSAPLATNDANETPLRGGLLAADYGRGRYIYTSMVWYRQLRAGIPGAFRIFANMISYGHAGGK